MNKENINPNNTSKSISQQNLPLLSHTYLSKIQDFSSILLSKNIDSDLSLLNEIK
jgi:hypothetical protein